MGNASRTLTVFWTSSQKRRKLTLVFGEANCLAELHENQLTSFLEGLRAARHQYRGGPGSMGCGSTWDRKLSSDSGVSQRGYVALQSGKQLTFTS